jgi:hypothetical protein
MMGGIPSTLARAAWPAVAPVLARAIARAPDRYSLETTLAMIEARRLQLWAAGCSRSDGADVQSVLVTELADYPLAKACRYVFAAGVLEDFIEAVPLVEGWARAEGCGAVEFNGRRGWEKPMAEAGYRFESICMRKEI